MKINKNNERKYVSFSQVAKLLNIKPHILIYWGKKIPQLKPYKVRNRKFYKKDQLDFLLEVKTLLDKGYSLEGIKKIFTQKKEKNTYFLSSEEKLKKLLEDTLKELEEIYKRL